MPGALPRPVRTWLSITIPAARKPNTSGIKFKKIGRRAEIFQADLANAPDTTALIHSIVTQLGRLDVLINNAGSYPVNPLLDMQPEQWRQVLDANLTATFLCLQAAARWMKTQGGGAIINISSIEARSPALGHAHYGSAKAGVDQLTRQAALELGQYDIRVNTVSPGLISSPTLEQDWPDGVARWHISAPLKRTGTPADIADACLFLASPAARWVTGANLVVDGGVLARPTF